MKTQYSISLAENRQWVVTWQSPTMSAPAFWYYDTKEEAIRVAGDDWEELCPSCRLPLDDENASEGGWDPVSDSCISCGELIGRSSAAYEPDLPSGWDTSFPK